MGDFIKNNPFRFWCQKVLPLVYDDSLSYYELLCKVVGKLNELAENQNNLSDEIKAVAKELDDFKNQVPGMVEAKVEEWLNNYITTHGLVNSVNGMTGVVTLTAADVGAIANVNGSVKNNNIADGAVTTEKIADGAVTGDKIAGKAITANKLADGVIPEKLPNPQKLTFTGAVTGEYDGSQAVNIDIPAGGGGGGGGAVDSVNGMTGAVVLKKLTAGEGMTMSGEDGYNGSAEQTVGIAPGGVSSDKIANGAVTADKMASGGISSDKIADGAITADKIASGVIPTKLPNPHKLTFTGAASGTYDGSADKSVKIPTVPSKLPNPNKLTFSGAVSGSSDGSSAVSVVIPSGIGYSLISGTITGVGSVTIGLYYTAERYIACSIRVNNTAAITPGNHNGTLQRIAAGPAESAQSGLCVLVSSNTYTPTYYARVSMQPNLVYVEIHASENIPGGNYTGARGSIVFE